MRSLPARIALLFGIVAGTARPGAAAQTAPAMNLRARAYLLAALDTIQAVTVRGDTVSWRLVRDSAFYFAAGADRESDTYAAIAWALHRANKHSFLQVPEPGAVSELLAGGLGYIHVPQRGGAGIALADSLHRAVANLAAAGACGWIVDLRDNGGGNMWPMLAGIGPLLGDSLVGMFGTGPDAERWYYADGTSGIRHSNGTVEVVTRITVPPVHLRERFPPVAVLLDDGTGSSGEAVAIAFVSRPNTKSFGSPTAGFATVNRGARLADSANMVVTTGYNSDRSGVTHPDRLLPDVLIPSPPPGWPTPRDRVARTAASWLAQTPACVRK